MLQVFLWLIFPQAPENNIRVILNFFENLRRYSQVTVHYRAAALVANMPPVSTTPAANLPADFNYTGGPRQICQQISTTPVAMASCHRYQKHRRLIYHLYRWCLWYRLQMCRRCQRHLSSLCLCLSSLHLSPWALSVSISLPSLSASAHFP